MPEHFQTTTAAGYDATKLQAIAYGTFQELGWSAKYAGENILLAYTPRKWNRYDNEITVETQDSQVTVTSKMIHGESFDTLGRTKKDVADFLTAFETVKAKAADTNITQWNEKITQLRSETIRGAGEEIKQVQEIDRVMNFSKGSRYITFGIIGINVLVFIIMVASGISIISPTGIDIINWGGNYGPLTLSGDWWRLVSCVFVHIGIIHLLFNMYALYMVGLYLEPMLGSTKYVVAYLSTGVFASLASLWWHHDPVPSAGASGAIFGMYGVFLALLTTNLIPKQVRNSLMQSIGIFVAYNLIYGLKSGVDNAAHIGGLISGIIIGYLFYPGLKPEAKRSLTVAALIAVLTIVATGFYLQNNVISAETRKAAKEEIGEYQHKDTEKFYEKYNAIIEMQNRAIVPLDDTALNASQRAERLQNVSLPEWDNAERVVKELKTLDVSDRARKKADVMQQYINLRKEQIKLYQKLANRNDQNTIMEIDDMGERIAKLVTELGSL